MDDDNDNESKLELDTAPAKPKWTPPNAGKGRPTGSQNKITKTFKEAMIESFDRLGGVEWLVKLGIEHPQTYAQIFARTLPIQVQQEIAHKMQVEFTTIIETAPTTIPADALSYDPAPIVDIDAVILEEAVEAVQMPEEALPPLPR